MDHKSLVTSIADFLKSYDSEMPKNPKNKKYRPGIGPLYEKHLEDRINSDLEKIGMKVIPTSEFDILFEHQNERWALELKIARPFNDNGTKAEHWTVNFLHPYEGNQSLIGDALKLLKSDNIQHRCLVAIGFEHNPAKISVEPLFRSFELICKNYGSISDSEDIPISPRVEEWRFNLVHREHQALRCASWELDQ